MRDNARRVALLARPGVAADRLREMIDEAGVERVLHADPTQLDAPDLIAAEPQVVVVALDPATEDVLDRFDAVLGDPMIDVIYEEAELAAAREGWDAARWKRHLVAKLLGHRDVLPPGTEPDDAHGAGADIVRLTGSLHASFDPVLAESEDYGRGAPESDVELIDFDLAFGTVAEPDGSADAGGIDGAVGDVAGMGGAGEPSLDIGAHVPVNAPLPAPTAGRLSLVDHDAPLHVAGATGGADDNAGFHHDMAELERRISGLELVDDTPVRGPEQANGAVLVMAGIGGPDAVRQFLGALPEGFPRPVLVQQRLDGGRHDRLVAQMQRATSLPVRLAEGGHAAVAGHVYVLPADMGLKTGGDGLSFCEGEDLLGALPSADSAVLLLSGSDVAVVDAALKHSWAGALVAGQAPEGCYDAAAANELLARGGDTGQPADLASRLAERWPG